MSIRIHGGRLIDAPIGEAYDMLVEMKRESARIGRDLETAWMARRAARIIDDAVMKGAAAEHPLHTAWCEMSDRQREVRKTLRRDPDVDFQFELWIWPLGTRTLINLHTEQEAFTKWFDALPFTRDHAYWDSVDPDETVDEADWRAREADWHAVWPVGGVPSDRCLTMVMFNDQLPLPVDAAEAVAHVPATAERLRAAASRRHLEEVYQRMIAEKRAEDPDWKMDGFGTVFEAEAASREETDRRAEIVENLRPLFRDLTADDLAPGR